MDRTDEQGQRIRQLEERLSRPNGAGLSINEFTEPRVGYRMPAGYGEKRETEEEPGAAP